MKGDYNEKTFNKMKLQQIKPYINHIKGLVDYGVVDAVFESDLIGMEEDKLIILGMYGVEHVPMDRFKPILRPLYQLMEDITIELEDGSETTINPVIEINRQIQEAGDKGDFGYGGVNSYSTPIFHYSGLVSGPIVLPFWIVSQLCEWGFDIYNLIRKGEAMSIDERNIFETSNGLFQIIPFSKLKHDELIKAENSYIVEGMNNESILEIIDVEHAHYSGVMFPPTYRNYKPNGYSFFDEDCTLQDSFRSLLKILDPNDEIKNPIIIKHK